jgi:hypothetical protein
MRSVSNEICREIQNTGFIFNTVILFRKSYGLWDNMEPDEPEMTNGTCELHA